MISSHVFLHDILSVFRHVIVTTCVSHSRLELCLSCFLFLSILRSLQCSHSHIINLVFSNFIVVVKNREVKLFRFKHIEI